MTDGMNGNALDAPTPIYGKIESQLVKIGACDGPTSKPMYVASRLGKARWSGNG